MKKFFSALAISGMVLMGGGCAASNIISPISSDNDIEGQWRLAFALPEGWVQVEGYSQPNTELPTLSQDVDHTMGMVTLQSTEKPIARTTTPAESIAKDAYVTENYTKIDVDWLDARRPIPKDAEDLGNGFWKAAPIANDCTPGSCTTTYYLQAPDGEKYLFTVWQEGQDLTVAEAVILSAEPVTVFTDTVPSAEVGEVQTKE